MLKNHVIAGFFVVLGLSIALPANAQPEPIKTAREAVIESIGKLDELKKNEDLEPAERAKQEAILKKEALENIIELSTLETENIKEKLSTIEVELAFEDFRTTLVEETEGYIEYFKATKALLKNTEGLDGIQKIAGELKDWRTETYDPGIVKAVDVILVFQNREALDTADQRFERLSADLKRRAAKIRQSWQPMLLRASSDLDEAHRLNNDAIELLAKYLPSDEPVSLKTQIIDPEIIEKATPSIRELVEKSVGKVKEAYGKFISLSDFLKR